MSAHPILFLGFSFLFYYPAGWLNISILAVYVAINYAFFYLLAKQENQRKKIFIAGLIFQISTLIIFRYRQQFVSPEFYPLGLSFYSFACIGFFIDLYYSRAELPTFLNFGSAVAYFPILISGPLVPIKKLYIQLATPKDMTSSQISEGFILISSGLFKKSISEMCNILIAHNEVFDQVAPGRHAWTQTIAYAAKYYADFSGYSDIAIGVSKLFGINIFPNFNTPFFASSVTDFWRRWHISLGKWANEYIFKFLCYGQSLNFLKRIPKFGLVMHSKRYYIALIATMAILGAWHGFTLNFLAWGLYMSLFMCIEDFSQDNFKIKIPKALRRILTLFILINGFVLFKNEQAAQILESYKKMYSFSWPTNYKYGILYLLLAILLFFGPHVIDYFLIKEKYFKNRNLYLVTTSLFFLTVHFLFLGFFGVNFVYSKF